MKWIQFHFSRNLRTLYKASLTTLFSPSFFIIDEITMKANYLAHEDKKLKSMNNRRCQPSL